MSYTGGKIAIIALGTLERVEATYVPLTLSGVIQGGGVGVKTTARNTPVYHVTGGVDEDINIRLDFGLEGTDRAEIIRRVEWVRALKYGNGETPPQYVKLVFGGVFKEVRYFIKALRWELSLFNENEDFTPQMGSVDLTLTVAPVNNPTHRDLFRYL